MYLSSSLMYSRMNSEGYFGSFSRWKMFLTFSSCNYQRKEHAVAYIHMQTQRHTHTNTHTQFTQPTHTLYTICYLSSTHHHPHSQTYTEYAPPPTPSLHFLIHSLLHYTPPPTPSFTILPRPLPPSLYSPLTHSHFASSPQATMLPPLTQPQHSPSNPPNPTSSSSSVLLFTTTTLHSQRNDMPRLQLVSSQQILNSITENSETTRTATMKKGVT